MLKEKIIELLNRDEPDYAAAADLGPESIPILLDLTKNGGKEIAPRAVYTASLIQYEKTNQVLEEGASSSIPDVRVATAAAFKNFNQQSMGDVDSNILTSLLQDEDAGVRKVTLSTISQNQINNTTVRSGVEKLVNQEENKQVRALAESVYKEMNP
ncbi:MULTISPECIES: HEAT repeat domain-containing protein [Bacillus cereus group]|uniref:HEAT repeat domain-containing protein n=1 Tax=Bacillus thuringiensis TaxID=1428 RepID=A0A1C4E209_BACTU|nr:MULTISPECIES: hypothetical protein [Bacillus cereus group]MED3025640.1 hypothetical protein [Bacillus wiedmannii]OTX98505.1 hypothetical protein BK729_13125 [Bacillus thuringiensis serovar wratislaviensis]OUB59107.1 hypothetical protein BK743_13025 [Bacillus thuringiensis serovar sylvestriensis]SCC37582.1 Uncharacterized protein BTT61001_02829 [Bacillus thuringiensis]